MLVGGGVTTDGTVEEFSAWLERANTDLGLVQEPMHSISSIKYFIKYFIAHLITYTQETIKEVNSQHLQEL